VPLYAQYELANFFEKQWLYDQCVKASVGWTIFSDQFALTCVIAHHGWSIDLSNGSHYCQPVGWVVTINGKKIYHAGDTALTMDMKLLGEWEQIDVAALPIGDVYTMGVKDAVKAVWFIKPKIVFPIHFDTFEKIKADAVWFAGCVMQQSSTVPKVLRPGQYIIID
jgi:L-ascorbate metabolism protein UlaG (beta-lactamase superfamily)